MNFSLKKLSQQIEKIKNNPLWILLSIGIIFIVGLVAFSVNIRALFWPKEELGINIKNSTLVNSPPIVNSPDTMVNYSTSIEGIEAIKQRHLSEEQKNIILDRISRIKNVKIIIFSNHSGESFEYQKEFEDIFREAGWILEHFSPEQRRKPHDLLIAKNSEYPNSKAFDYLNEALKASGIIFQDDEFTTNADDELSFDVGVITLEPLQEALDKSLSPF
mgnify:CR=1 FL=1